MKKIVIFKKILCIILCIGIMITFTGCWDYIRLTQLTIVSGVAIDKNEETNDYELTFEILDMNSSSKDTGIKTKLITSSGQTLFDAIRNAKRQLSNKLYFSDAQIVIISNTIARQDGVDSILDFFLRDLETRETIDFIISKEKTAREILNCQSTDSNILSYQIQATVQEDQLTTLSSIEVKLYEVFNNLNCPGHVLCLPTYHVIKRETNIIAEADGLALFKKDKLIGYLPAEKTKYYLFAIDNVEGGILTLKNLGSSLYDISLEISESQTKYDYSYENGKLTFIINIATNVSLGELAGSDEAQPEKPIEELEQAYNKQLSKQIIDLIQYAQKTYQTDIFGFGKCIYERDPNLWGEISDRWDSIFADAEFEVNPDITIKNSTLIR